MNLKGILLKLTAIILLVTFVAPQGCVFAMKLQDSEKAYFGVIEDMNYSEPSMAYALGSGSSNEKIWNVVRYASDPSSNQSQTPLYDGKKGNIYCIKSGTGFASGEGHTHEYDTYFNLETKEGRKDFLQNSTNTGARNF